MPISELNGLRTDTTTSYAGDMWNIINSLETKKVIGGIEMHRVAAPVCQNHEGNWCPLRPSPVLDVCWNLHGPLALKIGRVS